MSHRIKVTGFINIEDHEYDNLFVVTIPASGPVTTVRARYGPANPAPGAAPSMK